MDALALARLLQLASPALPVGGYTYSQGLEWAVECGAVRDEAGVLEWLRGLLHGPLAGYEAAVMLRALAAWRAADAESLRAWNDDFLASRESAELRAETVQMGYSCRTLWRDLGVLAPAIDALAAALDEIAYPIAWAGACAAWRIAPRDAALAYLWSGLENQVLAAVKLVPLGQTAGQRLLRDLAQTLPAAVEHAATLDDDALSSFAPRLAIFSSRHETQYTRLFRS